MKDPRQALADILRNIERLPEQQRVEALLWLHTCVLEVMEPEQIKRFRGALVEAGRDGRLSHEAVDRLCELIDGHQAVRELTRFQPPNAPPGR